MEPKPKWGIREETQQNLFNHFVELAATGKLIKEDVPQYQNVLEWYVQGLVELDPSLQGFDPVTFVLPIE